MTRLSVNINKIALLRNARGGNVPNLIQVASDCESFGAEGITVHPRPDQRHVRYDDIPLLRAIVTTEFNIEGNPDSDFLNLVLQNPPHQCTLVPDDPNQLTSDHGWNTIEDGARLKEITDVLHEKGIRVSVFVDPVPQMIEGAKKAGVDRIELYTGPFAHHFTTNPEMAMADYKKAAEVANQIGLGINAGHDLNLENLNYFYENCPGLLEVSIGHALISDALYYGLSNTIKMYRNRLQTH
jgi:pyridoxine 5-phosphate synthase